MEKLTVSWTPEGRKQPQLTTFLFLTFLLIFVFLSAYDGFISRCLRSVVLHHICLRQKQTGTSTEERVFQRHMKGLLPSLLWRSNPPWKLGKVWETPLERKTMNAALELSLPCVWELGFVIWSRHAQLLHLRVSCVNTNGVWYLSVLLERSTSSLSSF